MDDNGGCRLQICGPFFACVRGVDVSPRLPAGQARSLFVYLVVHRGVPQSRGNLIEALWPERVPEHAERDVAALLSRLRSVVGHAVLPSGTPVDLHLPAHAEVDLDSASAAIERAEQAVAVEDWSTAASAGHAALAIARRGFLPDVSLPWAERVRQRLRDVLLRAYEAVGEAGLGLGGPQILTTRQCASEVMAEEPLRESGYRLAMRAAVAQGNEAEAVQVYSRLRQRLAEELGLDPGPQSRALFEEVLARSTA